jgi:hypothetical protein
MSNEARPAQGKSWRDVLPIHPAAELFPLMSADELRELGEDIKKHGVRSPVILIAEDGKGDQLLDGRNRLDAMELVGLKVSGKRWLLDAKIPFEHCDGDPHEFVISANIHRRHLTAEQKRELIAKVLKAKPEASNRQIAKQVKADDKTVGKVRRELEATADIPQLDKTTGADGKARTTKRKRRDVDDFLADKRARQASEPVMCPECSRPATTPKAIARIKAATDQPDKSEPVVSDALAIVSELEQDQQRLILHFMCMTEAMTDTQRKRFTAGLRRMVESRADRGDESRRGPPRRGWDAWGNESIAADTAMPVHTPVEIPDLPEFLRRGKP